MSYNIELPDDVFAKLQKHAVPFIDTPVTVIERALRALEEGDEEPAAPTERGPRTFNPAAPPDLAFTTPRQAVVAGKVLPKSQTYWHNIMLAVIREAAVLGVCTDDLRALITVNCAKGERRGTGFSYVPEADLSIQGQNANNAWRQAYVIASSVGVRIEVVFAWQNNTKAALPNVEGSFFVDGDQG
jgi:hypothetical protein